MGMSPGSAKRVVAFVSHTSRTPDMRQEGNLIRVVCVCVCVRVCVRVCVCVGQWARVGTRGTAEDSGFLLCTRLCNMKD
jgi:hypothetical protein